MLFTLSDVASRIWRSPGDRTHKVSDPAPSGGVSKKPLINCPPASWGFRPGVEEGGNGISTGLSIKSTQLPAPHMRAAPKQPSSEALFGTGLVPDRIADRNRNEPDLRANSRSDQTNLKE